MRTASKAAFVALGLLLGFAASASAQTQCVTNAIAGGTVNALTVPLLPCGLATNLLLLTVQGPNTATNPTLQMVGYPALPIMDASGASLGTGVFPPDGGVVLLSGTGSSWLLIAGGTESLITNLSSVHPITTPGSYAAASTDQVIFVNRGSAGAESIVLPAVSNWSSCPAQPQSCPTISVKYAESDAGAAPITVTAAGGATIDSRASFPLQFVGQEQGFLLTGSGWSVK